MTHKEGEDAVMQSQGSLFQNRHAGATPLQVATPRWDLQAFVEAAGASVQGQTHRLLVHVMSARLKLMDEIVEEGIRHPLGASDPGVQLHTVFSGI